MLWISDEFIEWLTRADIQRPESSEEFSQVRDRRVTERPRLTVQTVAESTEPSLDWHYIRSDSDGGVLSRHSFIPAIVELSLYERSAAFLTRTLQHRDRRGRTCRLWPILVLYALNCKVIQQAHIE